jgi:hypothetical protein
VPEGRLISAGRDALHGVRDDHAVSVEPEGGSVHPSKNVVAVFSLQPGSG